MVGSYVNSGALSSTFSTFPVYFLMSPPLFFCCFSLVVFPLFLLLCSRSSFSPSLFFISQPCLVFVAVLLCSRPFDRYFLLFFFLSLNFLPFLVLPHTFDFRSSTDLLFHPFFFFFVPRFFLSDIPLHIPPTAMNAESETGPLLRQLAVIAARKRILALQQWRMVFYFPNAVHWAFHKPPFHPGVVAVLGLAEAIVGAIQAFPQPKSASA